MVNAARPKLVADAVSCGEPKVGYGKSKAAVEAEDVLWLQISVKDAQRMTIFDRIEKLEENVFDKTVVTEISPFVENLREEVATGAVVHNEEYVGSIVNNAVESYDVWVSGCELVQGNLLEM